MRTRDLFWSSAASATCIAITTSVSISSAFAKDPCVTSPGSETQPGSHWYYRVDRTTNRQCWYSKRSQETASTKKSTESALSRNTKIGAIRSRPPVTVESSVGLKKDIPRMSPRQEKIQLYYRLTLPNVRCCSGSSWNGTNESWLERSGKISSDIDKKSLLDEFWRRALT